MASILPSPDTFDVLISLIKSWDWTHPERQQPRHESHNEIEDELIAWRSLKSADINSAGPVRFRSLPNGRTEVKVVMTYEPPFGRLGMEIARFFGEDPAQHFETICSATNR